MSRNLLPVIQDRVWRNSAQLKGYRAAVKAAVSGCRDGAYVRLDLRTAEKLIEIIDQAIHTEKGHGV